ncbi:MAG TPA: TolC family protein [Bryobacteraceae bacterium]|nr:TolC family protein [Bryobacteraceae bacterium]
MAALLAFSSALLAQSPEVSITSPKPPRVVGPLLRPFHLEKRVVTPARLTDSPRLESLVRSGNLYLSARDVIALVLENNLDIAVQRYGSLLGQEVQRRAEGGGYLRQVDTPLIPGPLSVSLEGVTVGTSGLTGGVGSGGGIVSQIGPVPPNLDPNLVASMQFGHLTTPLTNTILNQTTALTNDYRQLFLQYSQQFATGTNGTLTYTSNRSMLNSPTPLLNPATSGFIDLVINQNLLQGFSIAVNKRDVTVAKNNIKFNTLQLKRQVITTVSAALNLYWDLASFDDDLRIKERALATAKKQYADNQIENRLGTLAGIELTRAAAAVSASQEDVVIAQTHVEQQEAVLKNALTRTGVESVWLDDVHIVPLDRIEVPKTEELKPTAELIQNALEARPEVEQLKVNLESNRVLLKGDKNGLLPTLQAFAELTNNGLSGPVNPLYNGCCGVPNAAFVGGYGNLLSQVADRKFPNYSAGVSLNIPLRNRAAQADYVTDQLQLRQNELQLQRAVNQVRVDVKTAVIGFQQARVRYENAVNTRVLAEQTLMAEQNRFNLGAAPDTSLLIQAQNNLSLTQSAEVQAMANYSHARIALDEAVGQTLDVNHISMEEATSGRVATASSIPDSIPAAEGRPR